MAVADETAPALDGNRPLARLSAAALHFRK
jgi:hypothetical protein